VQPDEYHDEKQAEPGAMTPLDPNQVNVLRIRFALAATAFALAAFALDIGPLRETTLPPLAVPGAILLFGLLVTLLYPGRRYRSWGYFEGEEEIEIGRGRWFQVRTIVPFGRVQHIDVAQGPIQRPFGLATLILHTAGTHGASVPLPGLRHQDAEAMRDRIRAKIKQDLV
jgi:membrane protein YdbS with pleckstrin-like domain